MNRAFGRSGGRAARYVFLASLCFFAGPAEGLSAQDVEAGQAVYLQWCAGCHGDTGAGDGEAARFMLPPPRDFTRALYQIRSTESGGLPTDGDLRHVVDKGMPGTTMPGWESKLSGTERENVIAYIKSFSQFFGDEAPQPLAFGKAPGVSADGLAEGANVYTELECFNCHGDAGRGDGKSASELTDDWDFPIRAADLTEPWFFNGGGTVDDIYRRLLTGLDGTPMPSHKDLIDGGIITEEQLWRLAQYVRSLGPEDTPPKVGDVVVARRVEGALPQDPSDSAWASTEAFYIPLVGQIIVKPRFFAPQVDGLWVRAMHNDEDLAVLVSWSDPNKSPDPRWQEWMDLIVPFMTDVDGPLSAVQGPDRVSVQFPMELSDGMDRPYFLGGARGDPVYLWRWTSAPDVAEAGQGTGLGNFTPADDGGLTHASHFENGQWRVQFTRAIVPSDSDAALSFELGRPIPMAFYAADGSNGEGQRRGAVSAWYAIYLEVPTPTGAFIAPLLTMLLTAGLGVMVVWRAQQRVRPAA